MKKEEKITFGEALEAMKKGEAITRDKWVGSFVFMQEPSNIPKIRVPHMQSLPTAVKQEFKDRFIEGMQETMTWDELHLNNVGEIRYQDQFAKVDNYNTVVGWTASVEDLLAEDWYILRS